VTKQQQRAPVAYRCPFCDFQMTIMRKQARRRAADHRKMLWCVRCGKRTNHYQVQEDSE
jgi:transcription elongation factor Elf1